MLIFFGLLLINYGLTQQICHGGDKNPDIAGRYVVSNSPYGGTQTITQQIWNSSGLIFHVCSVHNSEKELYAQNDINNEYNPGKFSRFEWTIDSSNNLYYCQQVYNANSLEEAEDFPRANPTTPAVNGCGVPQPPTNKTFFWSELSPIPAGGSSHPHYWLANLSPQTCFGSNIIPSIAGRYTDNYNGTQIVDQWIWNSTGLIFHLCLVNDNLLYAQNDGNNGWNPWKYSRFEWTVDSQSNSLWYCQQVYDAETLQQAEAAPRANPSNPSHGGCGATNNNWTQMIRLNSKHLKHQPGQTCFGGKEKPTIAGRYNDNYGGTQVVTRKSWRSGDLLFHICATHNHKKEIIAQNDGRNAWNPLKYSRFEWVTVENSHTLWYCQQVYDADTAQQAEAGPRADGSNPSVGGCGIPTSNFPWTQMIKVIAHQPNAKADGKKSCALNDPTPACGKEDL